MLLLEHPMRFSTDIDIIVTPGTDVDEYIRKAGTIFPFVTCEEQIRVGRNSIEKRHFKFIYQSPLQEKEFYILLDILFSEIPYVETIEKEVKNELLIVDGLKTMVTVPSPECILGDKLTAFAPHTKVVAVFELKYVNTSNNDKATEQWIMDDIKKFKRYIQEGQLNAQFYLAVIYENERKRMNWIDQRSSKHWANGKVTELDASIVGEEMWFVVNSYNGYVKE